MTAVIMEGSAAAGRAPQAPVIPDLTLPQFVLGAAHQYGGKRALVDAATGRELSYAELADAVREVAAGLTARGIRPGDVLALGTPNCLEFVVTWFAATSAGAIVTTVNPLCTGEEISRQLCQTEARWLVATAGLIEQKLTAVVGGTAIEETSVIGEGAAGTTPFGSLRVAADAPAGLASAYNVALLPTSSGTTGLPKSVELTHRNLVASLCQTRLVHRVTEDDVVIAALPLFHIYGLQITLNLTESATSTVASAPCEDAGQRTLDGMVALVSGGSRACSPGSMRSSATICTRCGCEPAFDRIPHPAGRAA